VEFSRSETAIALAAARSSLSIARTRALRGAIDAGTFETPARINGTVERLLDVIA